MAISSPGVGSNLDVNSIVSQLMGLERRPLIALDRKEATFQATISAYGQLRGQFSTFQTALRGLNDPNRFLSFRASVADSSVATVSAANSAAPGSYALEVTRLAQAQKLVAAGQASATAAIGTGTLTFELGTISGGTFNSTSGQYTGATFTASGSAARTVTIDAASSSLEGIRNAINSANIGVRASIVNDGGTTPHRLALTVTDSGRANSLRIGVTGDAALGSLLAHNPAGAQAMAETVTAQNAELRIDGVAVSKPTNTVTDAIEGVTLNLAKTNTGTPTTVSVTRDTGALKGSIESFVRAYNEVNRTIADLTAYNAATGRSSQLQGDTTVLVLQAQLRAAAGSALKGVGGGFSTLAQVGVGFQKDGTLTLDATRLQAAIDSAPNDISALFATAGKPTDAAIRFAGSSEATRAGSYAVNVSQLATRGGQTGSAAAGLTITAGVNDQVTADVDGTTASITLAAGTYATATDLARELQAKINGASAISAAGRSVTVSESAGVLTLTSARYGSTSAAAITSGSGRANLLGATPIATAGADVAGTINGVSASGTGQRLTDVSSGDAAGLKVDVIGGATGSRGTVAFSRGYAGVLDNLVTRFLASGGPLASRTEGLNNSIRDLDDRREQINRRLQDTETRLRQQYTSLDTLIGRLNTTSSFLTQQLARLDAQTRTR